MSSASHTVVDWMNNYTFRPYHPDVEFVGSHTNPQKESVKALAATFQ